MTGTNKLRGLNITGTIVPCDAADTYATHDSQYGKGGWREVNTIAERNAIPAERRRIGMVVFVKEDFTNYQLKGTATNDGWVVFGSSDADGQLTEAINTMSHRMDALNTMVTDALDTMDAKADKITVENKFNSIDAIIDTLETKVDAAGHLTKADLEEYMKSAEADEKFATIEEVEKKINAETVYEVFATKGELDTFVSDEEIKAYAKKVDLEPLATTEAMEEALAGKVDNDDLKDYVKSEELIEKTAGYVDADELEEALTPYVTAETLAENLENFVPSTVLTQYVTSDTLTQYVQADVLTQYVKTESLEENYVTQTEFTSRVEEVIGAYQEPKILKFEIAQPLWEKGAVANTELNWQLNKEITYQEISPNIGELAPSLRSCEIENVRSNTEYFLKVDDGNCQVTTKAMIKFLPATYYGVSNKETLVAEDILALNKKLLETREQTRIFDCSEGAYFYIVLQEDLIDDDILFRVSGTITTAIEEETIDLTNEYGYTARYKVYRSTNKMTGSKIPVEVL